MRRRMRLALALCLVLAATVAVANEPDDYIPTGSVTARIMQIAPLPRAEELAAKMRAAVAEHQEWFLEHVENTPEGEVLPYDPRLGVTEEEYAEFLSLGDSMTLQEVGTGILTFERPSEDVVVLSGRGIPAELLGIRIDLSRDSVTTDYGVLSTREEINNASPASLTGPWRGVQWELISLDGNLTSGVVAKLALGRLARSGEGILYFDAKEVSEGSVSRRASATIFYELD